MVSDVQALSATRAVPSMARSMTAAAATGAATFTAAVSARARGDVPVDQPGGLEDEQARLREVAA
jgi:hypothetical protein